MYALSRIITGLGDARGSPERNGGAGGDERSPGDVT